MPKRIRPRFKPQSKDAHLYVAISPDSVPPGLRWKRTVGARGVYTLTEYSLGREYKRLTDLVKKRVMYYKLGTPDAPATPKDVIDAEPERPKQIRYRKGSHCWFVDTDARWYLCLVTDRKPAPKDRITIRPVTGLDSTREKPWPYGGELEFPAVSGPLFARLRPLKAKRV